MTLRADPPARGPMGPVCTCPRCDAPVGDATRSGVLDAVCAQCRLKYRFVHGRVTQQSSEQVTLVPEGKNSSGSR